jgi:ADP-heptose:LPS heptosyltransferase
VPSLPALVGLLERADLLIGNDSGPRHIAEAVGTATVGVFTRGNLVDVAPLFRTRHRVLVSWDSACAVCGRDWSRDPCPHGATVLADVPAADVLAAARELLHAPRLSEPASGPPRARAAGGRAGV